MVTAAGEQDRRYQGLSRSFAGYVSEAKDWRWCSEDPDRRVSQRNDETDELTRPAQPSNSNRHKFTERPVFVPFGLAYYLP